MKKTFVRTALLLVVAVTFGACDAPTTSTTLEVTLTADPDPITAQPSTGVTYTVTNADDTKSTYTYPWKGSFVVTIQETGGLAVDITAVNLKVQQASGGIVITPSGGDTEYYRFNSSASGNHIAANGTASIGFDIWYALPNKQKEALVTVGLSFKDDDDNTYSETAQIKVAP
jgi:hypothetical protein